MRTPRAIVEALLEQSGGASAVLEDDFDLEAEFEQLPDARRMARWPFTRSELRNPEKCTENDVFMAMGCDRFGMAKRFDVRRNCNIVGHEVDTDEVDFDSLWNPWTAEDADEWRDVYVKDGRFAGFVHPEGTE